MARVPDLVPYCERHGLRMITVADLIEYRRRTEKLVERVVTVQLPTEYGGFTAIAFRETLTGRDHLALVMGELGGDVLVRVHSECLTGDVFHSLRCDCGEQLEAALAAITAETGREVPHVIKPRRAGDPTYLVADVSAAARTLNFRAAHSDLATIIRTAWAWHKTAHPLKTG